jgi:hypothetical protein
MILIFLCKNNRMRELPLLSSDFYFPYKIPLSKSFFEFNICLIWKKLLAFNFKNKWLMFSKFEIYE